MSHRGWRPYSRPGVGHADVRIVPSERTLAQPEEGSFCSGLSRLWVVRCQTDPAAISTRSGCIGVANGQAGGAKRLPELLWCWVGLLVLAAEVLGLDVVA